MKYVFYFLLFALLGYSVQSCKKDEGKRPAIEFRTGAGYTSSDTTVAVNSIVFIGLHAEKTEEEDVLKHFSASESVDGGANVTLDEAELSGADADVYDVDYTFTIPAQAGHTYKLTFTVTNRDGLTNQVSLTLTSI
jgi:hypothetical protein